MTTLSVLWTFFDYLQKGASAVHGKAEKLTDDMERSCRRAELGSGLVSGIRAEPGGRKGEGAKDNHRLRVGSWNIGFLSEKSLDVYAPHVVLHDEEKKIFWKDLDEMVKGVPSNEKFFIGGDFNRHIGSSLKCYDDVHGGYGFGIRNGEGVALLYFVRAFGLVIVNTNFSKKEVHLDTFCSSTAREVLGVSRGCSGKHQEDWWWNEEVKGKVETKKRAYAKLIGSKDEEDKWKNKEEYKIARREAKLVVMGAKDVAFKNLYILLASKGGDKKLYSLVKVRERRAWDLYRVKCIKDVDGKTLVDEARIRKI
ncbi:uncharacterized protein LOC124889598 [Capsicum annuum]|uniref:uncharacterized protein LOC124889598 n=1 Tax=Capsicum annuum TaxID=4072 RepID=UPI001FB0D30C|nr:uncharacterized protein LOC124889598 [Capsicum annuum]